MSFLNDISDYLFSNIQNKRINFGTPGKSVDLRPYIHLNQNGFNAWIKQNYLHLNYNGKTYNLGKIIREIDNVGYDEITTEDDCIYLIPKYLTLYY